MHMDCLYDFAGVEEEALALIFKFDPDFVGLAAVPGHEAGPY